MSITEQQPTIQLDLEDRSTLNSNDMYETVVVLDDGRVGDEILTDELLQNGHEIEEDEENNTKEYLKSMSTASTTIVCDEDEDSVDDEEEKENKSCLYENMNGNSTNTVKVVLEKSASTNFATIFPDAPTTPKVCRKAPYDDTVEVKEIVKKYHFDTSASEKSSANNTDKILIEDNYCCSTYSPSCNSLDCLVCNPDNPMHTKKSIEIDKGIIC